LTGAELWEYVQQEDEAGIYISKTLTSTLHSLIEDQTGGSMSLIETYAKELVSLIVPLVTWMLNNVFKPKAKLLLALPHTFTLLVQVPLLDKEGNQISPTQTVHTGSWLLSNAGTETAKNVELVFNWKPLCLNVWPQRHFTEHTEADNRYVIIFESLAPNEVVGCELLSINCDLPSLLNARSDQCVAKSIVMYPQPVAKAWQTRVFTVLSFAGLGLVVYLGIVLLQFLVLKTPFPFGH
jgi:hypothetical protein